MTQVHKICEIWQERPSEISYKCSCGHMFKHQRLGVTLRCPMEPVTAEYYSEDDLSRAYAAGYSMAQGELFDPTLDRRDLPSIHQQFRQWLREYLARPICTGEHVHWAMEPKVPTAGAVEMTNEQWEAVHEYVRQPDRRRRPNLRRRVETLIPDEKVREDAIAQARRSREWLARAYEHKGLEQPEGGWAPWLKDKA